MKQVELKDDWEHFSIRFSVYSSSIEDENNEHIRIMGSIPELTKNGSVKSGPKIMTRSKRKFRWLGDKYGQDIRPWECNIKFHVDTLEKVNEIIYSYSKTDMGGGDIVYERERSRIIKIQKP